MPSPNHDTNHLRLARKLGDPVASATTDGIFTSAQRNDYLNRANRFIQQFFRGRPDIERWIPGLIGVQEVGFPSGDSGVSLPADFSYTLSCTLLNGSKVILPYIDATRRHAIEAGLNINLQDAYTVEGNRLYLYEKGKIVVNGTMSHRYIKTDYRASANDTLDISIDSIWYDSLVEIAALYAAMDKGDLDHAAAYDRQVKVILAIVGGGQ